MYEAMGAILIQRSSEATPQGILVPLSGKQYLKATAGTLEELVSTNWSSFLEISANRENT